MTGSLFIRNERSGSYDPALVATLEARFADAGRPITARRNLGEDGPPDAQAAAGCDLAVILSGDGSVSATADALAGWPGTLLVLPGGTMNLLVQALHGPLTAEQIVEAYLAGKGASVPVPTIRCEAFTAYAGVMAGPTALWGDVREDLRNRDLASLGETVPRALAATFDAPGVSLSGTEADFPAIYLEPWPDGIHARGIQAGGAGDLLRHGLAWLGGDFRNGPAEEIAIADALTLVTPSGRLELLVDGERDMAPAPLSLRQEPSDVRFHAVKGCFDWLS